MEAIKISAPLLAYVTFLKDRHALDLELLRETAQVRSRSTSLKMSEIFEESIRSRIARQEILDRDLAGLGSAVSEALPSLFNCDESILPAHCPLGGQGVTDHSDCSEPLTVSEASFFHLSHKPHYQAESQAGKQMSAVAAASKNVAEWDANGYGLCGFLNKIEVPARTNPTRIQISSRVQSHFGWVEANALLPGASTVLRATAHIAVASNGQLFYSAHRLVGLQAGFEQLLSHKDLPTDSPEASFSLALNITAKEGANIEVLEFLELSAMEQNGHAYISGLFNWAPLRVSLGDGSPAGRPAGEENS